MLVCALAAGRMFQFFATAHSHQIQKCLVRIFSHYCIRNRWLQRGTSISELQDMLKTETAEICKALNSELTLLIAGWSRLPGLRAVGSAGARRQNEDVNPIIQFNARIVSKKLQRAISEVGASLKLTKKRHVDNAHCSIHIVPLKFQPTIVWICHVKAHANMQQVLEPHQLFCTQNFPHAISHSQDWSFHYCIRNRWLQRGTSISEMRLVLF